MEEMQIPTNTCAIRSTTKTFMPFYNHFIPVCISPVANPESNVLKQLVRSVPDIQKKRNFSGYIQVPHFFPPLAFTI